MPHTNVFYNRIGGMSSILAYKISFFGNFCNGAAGYQVMINKCGNDFCI